MSVAGIVHGFEAGLQVEFVENIVDVILDGLQGNDEPVGNLFVGEALGNLVKNVQFARSA